MKLYLLLIRIIIYGRNTVVRVRWEGWFYGRIYRDRSGYTVEKRARHVVEKKARMRLRQTQEPHGFFQEKDGEKSFGKARQTA